MKTLKGRTPAHLLLVLAIVVLAVGGCNDVSEAPTVPPEETFVISFDDFEETNGLTTLAAGNQSNWNYAAGVVGIWSIII